MQNNLDNHLLRRFDRLLIFNDSNSKKNLNLRNHISNLIFYRLIVQIESNLNDQIKKKKNINNLNKN